MLLILREECSFISMPSDEEELGVPAPLASYDRQAVAVYLYYNCIQGQ